MTVTEKWVRLSIKRAVFVDGNGNERMAARKTALFLAEVSKISSMARNRPVFLAEGSGYLHDLNENTNYQYAKWLNLKMEYPF